MAMNLSPQFPDITVFDGEGGGYHSWSASQSPLLSEAKLGTGKLVLHPHGFALPHYADSNKIGYVVEGTCILYFQESNIVWWLTAFVS